MSEEIRTPLEQPEGFIGEQVDFLDDGVLWHTELLSRDPVSSAYLNVRFPGNVDFSRDDSEEELLYSTPQLRVGWETALNSNEVIAAIRPLLADRQIEDYFCNPPTQDARYFTTNAYFSTSVDEVLKEERNMLSIHLLDLRDVIAWKRESVLGPRITFNTVDSLAMTEGFILELMLATAVPEKRTAVVAALEPLKTFYKKYVEIDFD